MTEQQDRATWWNAERTGEPCKHFCCRCGEKIKALHNYANLADGDVHARCFHKPERHTGQVSL